jgi:hypothetical protein
MMVRTSAKSTLTMPGNVIKSLMPCTTFRSTSSAFLNASIMDGIDLRCGADNFAVSISLDHMSLELADWAQVQMNQAGYDDVYDNDCGGCGYG